MMKTRLLQNRAEHEALYEELKAQGVDPDVFGEPPDEYPAMACWVERDINSMRYGYDASGDYIYLSSFTVELQCPVCGGDDANEAAWGLPCMCDTCYAHLSDLEEQGTDVEGLLRAEGKLPPDPPEGTPEERYETVQVCDTCFKEECAHTIGRVAAHHECQRCHGRVSPCRRGGICSDCRCPQ